MGDLTDKKLKSLKPKAKLVQVTDRDGRHAAVTPDGVISFRFQCQGDRAVAGVDHRPIPLRGARLGLSEANPMLRAGMLRGLADEKLSIAIHRTRESPAGAATIGDLAREAGVPRTVFFARFKQRVGMPPIAHLTLWRMALAKRLLATHRPLAEVARVIGHGATNAFVTVFRRQAGLSPARLAQAARRLEAT